MISPFLFILHYYFSCRPEERCAIETSILMERSCIQYVWYPGGTGPTAVEHLQYTNVTQEWYSNLEFYLIWVYMPHSCTTVSGHSNTMCVFMFSGSTIKVNLMLFNFTSMFVVFYMLRPSGVVAIWLLRIFPEIHIFIWKAEWQEGGDMEVLNCWFTSQRANSPKGQETRTQFRCPTWMAKGTSIWAMCSRPLARSWAWNHHSNSDASISNSNLTWCSTMPFYKGKV